MKAPSATAYAALGAGLIAMSYGVARFAFGLFVPPIRAELGLTADVMGTVGAMAFVSFALTSLVAAHLADWLGPRGTAMLASGLGIAGLTTISQSAGALPLAIGVFACGVCTGLMMPALSAGLGTSVALPLQGRVTAVMNAGTSFGVAVSVPTAFALANAWRATYVAFAAVAAACLVAAWRYLPRHASPVGSDGGREVSLARDQFVALARLATVAFGMGVASAVYWVFAPDMVVAQGGMGGGVSGWLWLTLGLAGLIGAMAGDAADRYGAGPAQSLALLVLAAALVIVTLFPGNLAVALSSAALFGVAYMSLTAIYVIAGIRLVPTRAALGPVVPFLAVAVGQAVGSPLAGLLISRFGHATAFLAFAAIAVGTAACLPLFPRTQCRIEAAP